MWADIDANQDFLNYSEVAELVLDVIKDPGLRPVTVGVFGTWGTGKSTILNLVEAQLIPTGGPSEFIVVRFDAWLHQGYDDARAALMEAIASALIEASANKPGVLAKSKRLFGRVNKLRALGLLVEGGALAMGVPTFGFASKGIAALSDVFGGSADEEDVEALQETAKEVKERGEKLIEPEAQRTPPKEIAAFRAEYEEILTELGKTLVVFVDNLDRCLPKQTIHTLEALRLFLFMGHTAFVVAADDDMVRHSVGEFFNDPDDRHVTDYLDKLVQVPVRVPRLGIQEVRAYLFLLFASAVNATDIEPLRDALESSLRNSWRDEPIATEKALSLLGTGATKEVAQGFAIADRIAPLLANSTLVQGNPRIVKRMLNVIRMRSRVAIRRKMPIDEALIAKVALFERCMDAKAIAHLYTEINASAEGKPQVFKTLESLLEEPAEKFKAACPELWLSKAEFVREWLTLHPPLAGADLRPLVYLSRETVPLRILKGTLSAPAAEALQTLCRITSTSSPAGNSALANIPPSEHSSVMTGLIEHLRTHSEWSTKPQGFDGALLLADLSPETGAQLSAFIHTVMPGKLRPWLNVLVKSKTWFEKKETR